MLKTNLKLSKLSIAGAMFLLFLLIALGLSFINNKQEVTPPEANKENQEQPLSYTYLSKPKININNQIAYIKADNLFVSDIDGSNAKQLTSYPIVKDAPAYKSNNIVYFEWSPDGKKIAYTTALEDSETKRREFQITIIGTETNTSVNSIAFSTLFISDVVPMHWFDSSNLLVAESFYEPKKEEYSPMINSQFYLIGIYSNHKESIIERNDLSGVLDFALSPDKKYLAFIGGAGNWINLYVIDLVKGTTQHTDYNAGSLGELSWSPSSQFLAYEVYGLSGYSSVSIYDITQKVDIDYNPEGGYLGETKSLDVVNIFQSMAMEDRKPFTDIYYNRWLQNDRLLFSTYYAHGEGRKDKKDIEKEINFWTVSANGENLKHIWNYKWVSTQSNAIGGVVFSDNFKKIVFKEYIAPDYTSELIYSMNIDGSNKREIANNKVE